jgi:pyrroline-5-carboxylate reductase
VKPILIIGAGRMGGALLNGWVKSKFAPLIAVEPSPSKQLSNFARRHRIALFARVDSIASLRAGACIVALKPQVLTHEAERLRPIADGGALMISIAAGTNTSTLKRAWGPKARIVRAMPNTPGAIGRGITALFAAKGVSAKDKALATRLLAALGETVWLKGESQIDAVTAVSASGPAYVFLLVEALAAAAVAEGLPRPLAEKLARATITGSGALLESDPSPPGRLRQNVTSPGGTTEAALKVLLANDGLQDLLGRAVAAARRRAQELS